MTTTRHYLDRRNKEAGKPLPLKQAINTYLENRKADIDNLIMTLKQNELK